MKNVKINLRQGITPLSNSQLTRNYNALREDLNTLSNDVVRINNQISGEITDKFEDIYERFNTLLDIIAGYHSNEDVRVLEDLKFYTRKERQQECIDAIYVNYNNLIEFFNDYYNTTTFNVYLLGVSPNNAPLNDNTRGAAVPQEEEKTIEEQIETILSSFNALITKLTTIPSNNNIDFDSLHIYVDEESNDEKLDLIVENFNNLIVLIIENFNDLSDDIKNSLASLRIIDGNVVIGGVVKPTEPEISLDEIEEQLNNDNVEIVQNNNGEDVIIEIPDIIETMSGDDDKLIQTVNDEIIITND